MEILNSDEALVKWQVANSNIERLQQRESSLVETCSDLEKNMTDYNGAKQLLELLKNYKLEKRKDFILGVVNSALKDIFQADYRLDILPRETKGKSVASTQKYDIIFYQNGIEIAKNDDLLTSNGGGVLSIASLFFKILIGYLYSKNKFYIFDEALSQVSPQYRARLSRFLREFCDHHKFTLVVVSQTEELEEHAHLVYTVDSTQEGGIPTLNIVDVIGEKPESDYFYSRIKNFQSVKDQTFIYKGFTIIRGPNNSGKSATLRAIDSILFNNFKTDIYPRKNPGGNNLTTEITFGYKGATTKEIGLKYRSGKVMFVIEGEEYFGKSLAADKLKEAVEEIGFRYIDVKQMYKNFKGALKEQTERIAYTNQYDGLFLIGSKASDSEKIFSFLFNTENIALAIAQAKEAMQEFNKVHKESQEALIQTKEELNHARKIADIYIKLYYLRLIQEYQKIEADLGAIQNKLTSISKFVEKTDLFISSAESAVWVKENLRLRNENQNKIEYNNTKIASIENILEKISMYADIHQAAALLSEIMTLKHNNLTIEEMVPKMSSVISIDYFLDLDSKLRSLNTTAVDQSIENLNQEYQLTTCEYCNGSGVHPTG